MNGLQIVTEAFVLAGIKIAGEALPSDDADAGINQANRMLSSWSVGGTTIYASTTVEYTPPTNTESFTIGPTGDVVSSRPLFFSNVQILIPGAIPYGSNLISLSPSKFQSMSMHKLTTIPGYYSYNPTIPNGIVSLYPRSLALYPIKMTFSEVLATMSKNIEYGMPPGYEEAIIASLAARLCLSYRLVASEDLKKLAYTSKLIIDSANIISQTSDVSGDPSAPGMRSGTTPSTIYGFIQP